MMNRDTLSENLSISVRIDGYDVTLISPVEQDNEIIEDVKKILMNSYINSVSHKKET